jgi:uncharacterized membrane protein
MTLSDKTCWRVAFWTPFFGWAILFIWAYFAFTGKFGLANYPLAYIPIAALWGVFLGSFLGIYCAWRYWRRQKRVATLLVSILLNVCLVGFFVSELVF